MEPDSGVVKGEGIPDVLSLVTTLAGDTVEDISVVVSCGPFVVRLVLRVDWGSVDVRMEVI